MDLPCSSCDASCVYVCKAPECPNPFACSKCSKNYFHHKHSQGQMVPFTTIQPFIRQAPITLPNNYEESVRKQFQDLCQRITRMMNEHLQDIKSKTAAPHEFSKRGRDVIQKIREPSAELKGDDIRYICEEIQSMNNMPQKREDESFMVDCLKDNFKHCYDRIDMAIKGFIPSWKFNPQRAKTLFEKGNVMANQNRDRTLVLRQFKNSRDHDPTNYECHFKIGAYQEENREKEKHFERCLKLIPNHFGSLNNIGLIRMQQNENRKAIEYFRRAIASYEDHRAYYNLGQSHEKLGQLEQALQNYQKANKMSPSMEYKGKIAFVSNLLNQQLRLSGISLGRQGYI